jgi:hypothetical protein
MGCQQVHTQEATCKHGLDYKEDMKVTPNNKKTLNGNFVKASESVSYCGFPEPWVKNEEKLNVGDLLRFQIDIEGRSGRERHRSCQN